MPRCEHPGCVSAGSFRAPRSRDDLRNYFAFCLDHVRQYNLAWDYFGSASRSAHRAEDYVNDPLGVFGATHRRTDHNGSGYRLSTQEEKALALLQVEPPITKDRIKARYKALVKRHHPDANGGDKAAEERLKEINLAYSTLKHAAFP